jgi:hypothetical protein
MNLILQDAFAGLFGLPSWNVKQGYGSFLTFEFGQLAAEGHGEWHLWIYSCSWTIRQGGKELAHSNSSRETIAAACQVLAGQSLRSVETVQRTRGMNFLFDLDVVLETCGKGYDGTYESWMLFRPNKQVFIYRHDGFYSLSSSNSNSDQRWQPLPDGE